MKKFLSYIVTFVVMFFISAAVTVSMSMSGGGSLLLPSQDDTQASGSSFFNGILKTFEENKQFNVMGNLEIKTEDQVIPVSLFVNIDLEDASNIKVEGFVIANIDQKYTVEFSLYNNCLYLSFEDINVKLNINGFSELIDTLSNILGTGNQNDTSSFVEDLMPTLMGALDNLKETVTADGEKLVEITIDNLVSAQILLDKDEKLKKASLETIDLDGVSLTAVLDITFDEEIVITNPEKSIPVREFFDVYELYNLNFGSGNLFNSFDYQIGINALNSCQSLNGYAVIDNGLSMVGNLNGFVSQSFRLDFIDNQLFVNVGDIRVKLDIASLDRLPASEQTKAGIGILSSMPSISTDISIDSILSLLKQSKVCLSKNQVLLKTNLNALGINLEAEIVLALNNYEIENISIVASLEQNEFNINLCKASHQKPASIDGNKYLDVVNFVESTMENFTLSEGNIFASIEVLSGNKQYLANANIFVSAINQYFSADMNIAGDMAFDANIAMQNGRLFLRSNGTALSVETERVYQLVKFLANSNIIKNINVEDLSKLLGTSSDLVGGFDINDLKCIKTLSVDASQIKLVVDGDVFGSHSDITLIITLEDYIVSEIELMGIEIEDTKVNAKFNLYGGEVEQKYYNPNDYANLDSVVSLSEAAVKTLYQDGIKGSIYANFELFGEINELKLEYGFNFDNCNLNGYIVTNFKGLDINLYFIDGTFYANIIGLKVYVEFTEFGDLINYLSREFGLELDGFDINNLLQSLKDVDLSQIILGYIGGEKSVELNLANDITIFVNFDEFVNQVIVRVKNVYVELNVFSYDSSEIDNLNKDEFGHYSIIKDTVSAIKNTLSENQFSINAIANVYEDNMLTYNANVDLAVDMSEAFKASANVSLTGKQNISLNVNYIDSKLFVNYNKLKLSASKQSISELLALVMQMLGIDASNVGILDNVISGMDVDMSVLQSIMPSMDMKNPLNMLTVIKNISIVNNQFIITLNGDLVSSGAGDMTVKLSINANGIESIELNNIYAGNASERFDLKILFNEFNGVSEAFEPDSYIDISNSVDLLKAFINTAQLTDYHIAGQAKLAIVGISAASLFIDARIKLDENKVPTIAVSISNYPIVAGITNEFTNGGISKKRTITIYYHDGALYLKTFDAKVLGASEYTKVTKITLNDLVNDMSYYMQWLLGFKDNIQSKIDEAIKKSQEYEGETDISNILLGYTFEDNVHKLQINLAEIAHNDDLGTLSLELGTKNDEQTKNKEFIYELGLKVNFFGNLLALETDKDNKLYLTDIYEPVDLTEAMDYINSYSFGFNAEYKREGNGEFVQTNAQNITITLNSDGELSYLTGVVGQGLSLPILSKVLDDGNKITYYTFAGWYTSDGQKFTGSSYPKSDITLYARYNIDYIKYYYYINYIYNGNVDSVKVLEGSLVDLLTLANMYQELGDDYIEYSFAGWYLNENLSGERIHSLEINENINLYAKWKEERRVSKKLLTIYDNGTLVFSDKLVVGDVVKLPNGIAKDANTKLYLNSDYTDEYTLIVMPNEDLTLHVRNKYVLHVASEHGILVDDYLELYQGENFELVNQNDFVKDIYGVSKTTGVFVGWSYAGNIMPNSDLTITANWDIDVKQYFTVTIHNDWYRPAGWVTDGNIQTSFENTITLQPMLEGSEIDLSAYFMTIKVKYGINYTYKITGFSESTKGSGTKITSIASLDKNYDLYAVWKRA